MLWRGKEIKETVLITFLRAWENGSWDILEEEYPYSFCFTDRMYISLHKEDHASDVDPRGKVVHIAVLNANRELA